MEKNALTDLSVQRLKPGTYMDAKTPAFGIRIGKHRKTWIATKGKERRVVTLGHYPAMSLAEARRKALATFVAPSVSTGSITFPEAREAFLAQDRWRVGSKRVLASNLSKFHWTGPLARITHEQVAQTIDAIDKPSARAHALKDIRTFFNWCVPRYLAASPAAGLRMPTQRSRDRVLTDEELATIWNSCEGDFGTIVKLLLLTGQRRGEVGSLRWSHVGNDRITLPPQSTKNNREHSFREDDAGRGAPVGRGAAAALLDRFL